MTSSILKQECKACGKLAVEDYRLVIGRSTLIKLTCGHLTAYASDIKNEFSYDSVVFSDGGRPRPYQIEAVKFAEKNNFNVIIADEQGLGKTIEVLTLIKLNSSKLLPAVIAVPTSVKLQWAREIDRICCPNKTIEERKEFLTQIIQSGKDIALPGFSIYLVSFDMLKKQNIFSEIESSLKTIIIDECQRIKNHLSDRAKAVQRLAKNCEFKIPMSGTPIKNNAAEYFTILNLVAPSKFPHYQRFVDNYCQTYSKNGYEKIGGLYDAKAFHEEVKDLIIRRTKDEVLKDLPSKERKFFHVELDKKLNTAYAKTLEELENLFYNEDYGSFESSCQTIAIMSKLRHITGLSKIESCIDFVTEFLLSSDRRITIFVHHKDVGEILNTKLSSYCKDGNIEPPLMLTSDLSSDRRDRIIQQFKQENSRILIASTLAAGEGVNLQFCSDAVMLERQWNPPNEIQAEDRFHRFGQSNAVSITYMLASGTIDEYFTELVEKKRVIISATMDNKELQWDEQNLMKELAQMLVTKGREKWKL